MLTYEQILTRKDKFAKSSPQTTCQNGTRNGKNQKLGVRWRQNSTPWKLHVWKTPKLVTSTACKTIFVEH